MYLEISHEWFKTFFREKEKYKRIKENIRMMKSSDEMTENNKNIRENRDNVLNFKKINMSKMFEHANFLVLKYLLKTKSTT